MATCCHFAGLNVMHHCQKKTITVGDTVLHRESKKTRQLTLVHNFTKYWPIFKILSLLDSVGSL